LIDHLHRRLQADRQTTVPWLASAAPLEQANLLEVGTGTGTSTIAMAEQGAVVTGIDVDEEPLMIARKRCELYGLNATLEVLNATDIANRFGAESFDFVVFYASIEHMTYEERRKALEAAWTVTKPGGIVSITGTPNRLWHLDFHTSRLPFFNWLPDEIAALYATRSPRIEFATADLDPLTLARWGRGYSYHEIELALGALDGTMILEGRQDFIRKRSPLMLLHSVVSSARRFERFLERTYPTIDRSFFRLRIDIMLRKPNQNLTKTEAAPKSRQVLCP
jgi:S-adenosylmethionine-dependent methyltransferase